MKKSLIEQQLKTLKDKVNAGKTLTPTELRSYARLEADLDDVQEDLVFKNVSDVAEYSGYAKRTVRDAVSKGYLIRQHDKTFLQDDVFAWMSARGKTPAKEKEHKEISGQTEMFDRAEEEAAYRHYRAVREKLLVERLQGELMPIADVQHQFVIRAHEYKTALMLLSRRIGHKIAAKSGIESTEVRKIIDNDVRGILTELCRPIEVEN